MKALRRLSIGLFKAIALFLAILGAILSPMGLAFIPCIGINQQPHETVSLWDSDYCSGFAGMFLILTTFELFYLGILTEFRMIPRWAGLVGMGMTGAIAIAYLVGILTAHR